jgi:hypothetical protein
VKPAYVFTEGEVVTGLILLMQRDGVALDWLDRPYHWNLHGAQQSDLKATFCLEITPE